MPLGTSFTLQGSNPLAKIGSQSSTPAFASGGTPQATALNKASGSSLPWPTTTTPYNGEAPAFKVTQNPLVSQSGGAGSANSTPASTTPGLVNMAQANTSVDSKMSIPAIKSVTTTYHPPADTTSTGGSTNAGAQTSVATPTGNTGFTGAGTQNGQTGMFNNGVFTQTPNGAPDTSTYGGLLSKGQESLAQAAALTGEEGKLKQAMQTETQNVYGNPYYSGSVKIGQAGLIQQNQGTQLEGLTAAQTANQATGQSYLDAAGKAAPVQVPYSNQYINPQTGQSVGGGSAGQLPPDAQNVVNTYAQQVKSGTMTRADAESRLGAYGVAGINALTNALGTDFNTNASNASAGTTQQGQQLQTAANATNQALTTLQSLYNSLPTTSTTGIPGVNAAGNFVEKLLGSSALTTYKQTLADARAQLQGVLTASGAATPTGAESAAMTYLPDNMSPDQLKQAIGNVQTLIQQKVKSFTNSGNQSNSSSGSSGGSSAGSWASLGDKLRR